MNPIDLRTDVTFEGRELVFAVWAINRDSSHRYVHHLGGVPLRPTAHLSVNGSTLGVLFGAPPPQPGVHLVRPILAAATRLAPGQQVFFETRVAFPLEVPGRKPGDATVTDAVITVQHRVPHRDTRVQEIDGSDAVWAFGGPVEQAYANLRLPGPFAIAIAV